MNYRESGETMNVNGNIRRILIILITILLIHPLVAKGSLESEIEYKKELYDTYDLLILEVDNGNLTTLEAKAQLSEIRNRFGVNYNDEAGILEANIDSVAEKRMTVEEAQLYASLMRENKYLEYKREEIRVRERSQSSDENQNQDSENKGKDDDGPPKTGNEDRGKK